MRIFRSATCFIFLFSVLGSASAFSREAQQDIPIHLNAPAFIRLLCEKPSLTLAFSDFLQDSTSDVKVIAYTVTANGVERDKGILLASLNETFPDIKFEMEFGGYTPKKGNIALEGAAPGFLPIGTGQTDLAHKAEGHGKKRVLSGDFALRCRATLLKDMPSQNGDPVRMLTISFVDA